MKISYFIKIFLILKLRFTPFFNNFDKKFILEIYT